MAAHGPFRWPVARRGLIALAEELTHSASDAASPEQIWVDESWELRLIDVPLGDGSLHARPAVELLSEAARTILLGSGPGSPELPLDLPGHAELVVERLLGRGAPFPNLREARDSLDRLGAEPSFLTARARAVQLGIACAIPVLIALCLTTAIIVSPEFDDFVIQHLIRELRVGEIASTENLNDTSHVALDEDGRRARRILIARSASNRLTPPVRDPRDASADAEDAEIRLQAAALYPNPSLEQSRWAESRVEQEWREHARENLDELNDFQAAHVSEVGMYLTLLWGASAAILAFALRGGLSFWMGGVAVRVSNGRMASRWRCAWRSLVVSLSLGSLYFAANSLAKHGHELPAWILIGMAIVLNLFGIVSALTRPEVSIQDRLAGTRLVPR